MMTVFLYSRLYCCLLLLLSSLSGVTAFATVPFNVISMTTSTMTSALTTVTAAATGGITNGVGTSAASILPSLSLLLDNEANTNILIATVVGVAVSSVEGGNVVEETAAVITTTRQVGGLINWDNPAESIGGAITLLYIVFSILAGIKYIVKDGWRPKM